MRICWVLLMLIGIFCEGSSQEQSPSSPEAIEKEYQKRIKKERLYGVYIPKDLADAFCRIK